MKGLEKKVIKGLELTYRKLIEYKKYKNSPVIVSKNGKVVSIDPNDMPATIKYKP
jgi:sulfur carrier protein ThiS